MDARQVYASEKQVLRQVRGMVADIAGEALTLRCDPTLALTADVQQQIAGKLDAASKEHTGVGLFVAFDDEGMPQGMCLTRAGRTSLLLCHAATFDDAAAAVLAEARRVKGPGTGNVSNESVRVRLAALGLKGLHVEGETVIFG